MKARINLKFIWRAIALAAPVVGGQLGIVLMGTTDTIMCGKVGNAAQAAVGMGSAVYFLYFVLGMGLFQGITTLVSIADGAQEREYTKKNFMAGLVLIIPATIVINLLVWLTSLALNQLNLPLDVLTHTQTYLSILMWGTPGLLLFILLSAYLNGLSLTIPTMLATFVALIANYYLNKILIFGWTEIPAYGFEGSAYATNISRYLLALLLILFVLIYQPVRKLFRLPVNYKLLDEIKQVNRIGFPIGIQLFLEVFAFTVSFILAGWIGSIEVATHQNVLNIASVTFMFITGISTASNIMIGNGFGAKDKEHIKEAALACLYLIVGIEIIFAGLFVFGGEILLSYYTLDPKIIELGAPLMVIAAAFQLSDGLQNLGLNMLRGIKDVRIPASIAFICYWLIMVPICYLLALKMDMGLNGIWWGFVIGLSLASGLLLNRFYKQFQSIESKW